MPQTPLTDSLTSISHGLMLGTSDSVTWNLNVFPSRWYGGFS